MTHVVVVSVGRESVVVAEGASNEATKEERKDNSRAPLLREDVAKGSVAPIARGGKAWRTPVSHASS